MPDPLCSLEIVGVDIILELYSDFMRVEVTLSFLSVLLLFFAVFHRLVLHEIVLPWELVRELEQEGLVGPIYAVRSRAILEMYLNIVILQHFVVKRFVVQRFVVQRIVAP